MRGLFNAKPSESDCLSCGDYAGKSRGVGDDITRIAKLTGIGKLAKASNCGGCAERRRKANERFPRKNY